jgi:L-asparagine oxygenase
MDHSFEPVEPSPDGRVHRALALPAVDTINLTAYEQRAITSATAELAGIDPVGNAEGFITEAQVLAAVVPRRVRRALVGFRRHGSPSGGLLIRGLPIGLVPKTPLMADHSPGALLEGARAMIVVTALLGDAYGYRAELGGQIVQTIAPVGGRETTQESVSSLEALLVHNETVFTEHRADYVALCCLRADHDHRAGTTLSSGRQILRKLSSREIELLRQPIWATTVDGSFIRGADIEGSVLVGPFEILEGSILRPRFRCDFAETRPLDPNDQEAAGTLQRLWEVVLECAVEIRLAPSDLLVVDNHESFHGRTAFVPRYDGWDRWLLRSFLAKDLSRSGPDRPADGRIVDRDYTQGPEVLWVGSRRPHIERRAS